MFLFRPDGPARMLGIKERQESDGSQKEERNGERSTDRLTRGSDGEEDEERSERIRRLKTKEKE